MYRLKKENTISTDGKVTVQADKDKFKINIDGKSTQATRSGKNLLDASKIANTAIKVLDNGKTIKMPVMTSGNGYVSTSVKLSNLCPNLKVGDEVYLFLETTSNINKFIYLSLSSYIWRRNTLRTITQADLDSTVSLYGNRFQDGETEQVIISNLMITKENDNTWEPYGASPSPEFPSEIKSVGDDVNLIDIDDITFTNYYTVNLELEAGTYTFSADIESNDTDSSICRVYFYKEATLMGYINLSRNIRTSATIELADSITRMVLYASYDYSHSTGDIATFTKIKLQKGTVATPYSKYGEGTVTIEQRGKNLWTLNSSYTTTTGSEYVLRDTIIKTIPAGTYTLSLKKSVNSNVLFAFKNSSNKETDIYLNGAEQKTINFESDIVKVAIYIYGNQACTISNIQLEESTEATDYEPYFSKDYVIQTTPLRSLPNGTKDTIEEDGIHRRVGRVVLDGSESWGISGTSTSGIYRPVCSALNGIIKAPSSPNISPAILCDYYNAITNNQSYTKTEGISIATSGRIEIYDSNYDTDDISLYKDWLSTHNTEVLYELSEEVVEPFTDEQQAVLNSMITEKGTNIFDINEDTRITINYTPEFTDEIKHAFRYGVTRGYLEVLDGSELIINEDNYLQSIDFDDERYVDGEGIIGTTVAKSLEGKFVNVDSEFSVENKELQAYIGAELDDGTTKYIDLGTFIVQKPDNDNVKDNTSFTSLDYMVKFNQTYKDTITYPCTLGQLLQNVCDQVGIVLGTKTFRNSNFLVENNQFVNNESCREVLKAIAQMAFSWARINQDNELVLDFNLIDEPTAEFDYDEYYDLTSNEQYGPVNTIILKNSQVEGENYTVKNQDLIDEAGKEIALTISDNPFAYTQAKRSQLIQAGKELFGFKYIPFTTKTIGYIYLNCQDKIRIKNMQDKLLDSYLFNNKFSYEGSISDNKETSAMTETETKYQFTDTVEKKLNAKIARTEIIVDKANQEITEVVEKQTEYDKSLTEIKAGLGSVTSTVEEIKNFKRSKRSTNEIYITDAMEDGTLSFTAIGNESVNVVLFPLNNLYPSDDLYGGNEYDG